MTLDVIMKQPEILVIKSTGELEIPIQTAVLFNIGYP